MLQVTKLPVTMKNLRYEDRLKSFNLTTLQERRERGDAIQLYKFNSGINIINWHHPVGQMNRGNTDGPANSVRGLNQRLSSQLTRIKQREHFFSNRVVRIWNNTPDDIWKAKSTNGFKNAYDKHTRNKATMSKSVMRLAPAKE